ncbi:MAG: trehalose synthase [Hamadaea sp.]|nr:trehalose synthase [Hamadaea sp.]
MNDPALVDLWWKNGLIYCVDVKSWRDSDGDGIGDLTGLAGSLDYLASLGVTCLWLMPICPSPWRDDGYDVTDYYAVDHRLGTLGDFVSCLHAAHAAGMRVILDLPLNHTSDEHFWFQQARADRRSRYRDFYNWHDEPPENLPPPIFPGEQESTCTYDPVAGQYYLHRYYDFMPDLDTRNPEVRQEIIKILGFWLALGVDGFRLDSVPILIEEIRDGSGDGASHAFLRDLHAFVSRRSGDAALVGEANLPVDQLQLFFGGDGAEEMQVLFDFQTCAGMWLAMASGEAKALAGHLAGRPTAPPVAQHLTFLRHHDELSFEYALSDAEADQVYGAFAPDKRHRAYDRGIRRRLAPMFGGDPARIRMALSLLLSLPGLPAILYGDELGLGDNLDLHGRLAVRTLMQWNTGHNGGFSTAEPDRLIRPPAPDGPYGYRQISVAAQMGDPGSQLSWFRHAAVIRRQSPEVGTGEHRLVEVADPHVLAIRYTRDHDMVVLHNFGAEPVTVQVADVRDGSYDILADSGYDAPRGGEVRLRGYGFRWLRLR